MGNQPIAHGQILISFFIMRKLSYIQRDFFHKYHSTYQHIIFCNDATAIVGYNQEKILDYYPDFGAVNMKNEIIVPFKYYKVFKCGLFFFAIDDFNDIDLYDIKGKYYGKFSQISKTNFPIIIKIYNEEDPNTFRLIFRHKKISKGSFDADYCVSDGIMLLHSVSNNWGAIKNTSLIIPFKYCAITTVQHTYAFGLIEKTVKNSILYDCEIMKLSKQKSKILGLLFSNQDIERTKAILSQKDYHFESRIDTQVLQILKEIPPSKLTWLVTDENNQKLSGLGYMEIYTKEDEEVFCDSNEKEEYDDGHDLLNDVFDGDYEAMASCFID